MPDDAAGAAQVPGVQYVSAGVNSRGQVIAGNQNWSTQIQGTDVDFQLIRSWPTKYGAFFTPQDVSSAAKVAVLGTVVADTLFGPDVDPTGEIIRIRNQPFKVIGVMSPQGQSAPSARIRTTRSSRPYTTVQKKLQGQPAHQQHHRRRPRRRTRRRWPRRSARRCGFVTSCRPATRTTSRSARTKRSPASARKRPRR